MRLSLLIPLAAAALPLAACDSSDPADGGFFNGVQGLSSGTYEARIDEREAALTEAQRRNAALNAEISRLQGELDGAKAALARERSRLRAEGKTLSPADDAKVTALLTAVPAGDTPEAHAAALRQTILAARDMAELLARSG